MDFIVLLLNLPEILSSVYAILMIVGYIPGLYALIKYKDLSGVGRYFWFFIIITVGITFHNLIKTGAIDFQIYAVGINLLLGVVCLLIYLIKLKDKKVIIDIIVFGILTYLYTSLLADKPNITQTIASVSIILAYLGQIRHYMVYKTASGTSRWLFLIMGTGLISLVLSMILTDTYPHIIATELFNFILIMVCYLLANYYERGLKDERDIKLREGS